MGPAPPEAGGMDGLYLISGPVEKGIVRLDKLPRPGLSLIMRPSTKERGHDDLI